MPTQRELEMARGAEIAERHRLEAEAIAIGNAPDPEVEERREVLRRWEDANKVHFVRQAHATNQMEVTAWVSDCAVAMEIYSKQWPSVVFVGRCGIAIAAMENFDNVPSTSARTRERDAKAAQALQERKRKDEARAKVHNWSKDPMETKW